MTYRIRTIAQRAGMSPMTLRGWERRYGFPHPQRTGSGYRTYSEDDLQAVLAVRRHIEAGLAASEAISLVKSGQVITPVSPALLVEQFIAAAQVMQERELERLASLAETGLAPVAFCREFALPSLRQAALHLGIAGEHLASGILRSHMRRVIERIAAPARGHATYVLACPSGEEHEGGLLATAVELRLAGARTVVLGANTPAEAIAATVQQVQPRAVALSLVGPRPTAEVRSLIAEVVKASGKVPVIVGGSGARAHLRAVYEAGAHFAESVDEFMSVLSTLSAA